MGELGSRRLEHVAIVGQSQEKFVGWEFGCRPRLDSGYCIRLRLAAVSTAIAERSVRTRWIRSCELTTLSVAVSLAQAGQRQTHCQRRRNS